MLALGSQPWWELGSEPYQGLGSMWAERRRWLVGLRLMMALGGACRGC